MPTVQDRYRELLTSVGRAGLHYLFPRDFEYYICSLELTKVSSNNEEITTDFFVFPVMPEQINYVSPKITTIKKSAGGITSLKTTTFVPKEYVINGNFGRKFKFLLGNVEVEGGAFSFQFPFDLRFGSFDIKIKTGYGAIKVLEHLYEKSSNLSKEGWPYKVYFYNPALGHSYLVELTNLRLNQSKDLNMIWSYTLNMSVVSPIYDRKIMKKSLLKTLLFDNISKVMDIAIDKLRQSLFQSTDGSKYDKYYYGSKKPFKF